MAKSRIELVRIEELPPGPTLEEMTVSELKKQIRAMRSWREKADEKLAMAEAEIARRQKGGARKERLKSGGLVRSGRGLAPGRIVKKPKA